MFVIGTGTAGSRLLSLAPGALGLVSSQPKDISSRAPISNLEFSFSRRWIDSLFLRLDGDVFIVLLFSRVFPVSHVTVVAWFWLTSCTCLHFAPDVSFDNRHADPSVSVGFLILGTTVFPRDAPLHAIETTPTCSVDSWRLLSS